MSTKDKVALLKEYIATLNIVAMVLIRDDKDGNYSGPGMVVRDAMQHLEKAFGASPWPVDSHLKVVQ